jgi:hypothetical protein
LIQRALLQEMPGYPGIFFAFFYGGGGAGKR